jgi:hypothetical protein
MGSTISYIMTAMMREAERLQFMAALLESVAEALGDLTNGLHCLAEGLCQESKPSMCCRLFAIFARQSDWPTGCGGSGFLDSGIS